MKRKSLVALCTLLLLPAGKVSAQMITPFTPRTTNEKGERVYVQPQQRQNSRLAITAGWGYLPATAMNSMANKKFPFIYSSGKQAEDGDITSSLGAIHIGINYEITPWLELNVPIVYTHSKGDQPYVISTTVKDIDMSGTLKDNWISIVPNLRLNWARNNWLSIYSRAGVGLGIANRWVSVDADQTTKCVVAWQASPLGLEFGSRNLCFFVEGGYGYMGTVMAGIKLKVGKMTADGKVHRGREVEWYEKYFR